MMAFFLNGGAPRSPDSCMFADIAHLLYRSRELNLLGMVEYEFIRISGMRRLVSTTYARIGPNGVVGALVPCLLEV